MQQRHHAQSDTSQEHVNNYDNFHAHVKKDAHDKPHEMMVNVSHENSVGPHKYYAVGGTIDLIESVTWDGFGNYYETLSNAFLNNVLYKNISRGKQKTEYTDVNNIYLFKNKEDALIFSDLFKDNDRGDLCMFRTPIFEIEINDNSLVFENKELHKIPKNIHLNIFNDPYHPLLHNKKNQNINYCQIHKNDEQFQSFKANATIKSSHLIGYNNLGEEKFHLRTLFKKTNRKFFDGWMILVFLLTFWWSGFLVPIGYGIYRFFEQKNANDRLKASMDYHQYSHLLEMHDKNTLKHEGYLFPDVNPQHSHNQANTPVENNLETETTEKFQYTEVYKQANADLDNLHAEFRQSIDDTHKGMDNLHNKHPQLSKNPLG